MKSLERIGGRGNSSSKCRGSEGGTILEECKGQCGWSIMSRRLNGWRCDRERCETEHMSQSLAGLVKNLEYILSIGDPLNVFKQRSDKN